METQNFSVTFDRIGLDPDNNEHLQKSLANAGDVIERYQFTPLGLPPEQQMRFGGWASTRDKDFDGEVIDPKLMSLGYVSKNGMKIFWEHGDPSGYDYIPLEKRSTMPGNTVAHVTEVRKHDYGIWVDGEMYWSDDPDSLIRKSREELALSKQGGDPVKLSVEGSYGKSLPNGLRETVLTGAVFTKKPINPHSLVQLYKSMMAPTYQTDPAQKTGVDALTYEGDRDKLKKTFGEDLYKSVVSLCKSEDTACRILDTIAKSKYQLSKSTYQQLMLNLKAASDKLNQR